MYGEFLIVAIVIVFRDKGDGNKQKEEAKGRNSGLVNQRCGMNGHSEQLVQKLASTSQTASSKDSASLSPNMLLKSSSNAA
jgi:hypothetical protein